MKVTLLNEEKGIILPLVLILMLALTITGLAFLNMGVMEHRLVKKEVTKNQAFYLAEAGIEHARVKLGQDWDYTSPFTSPLGEGNYNVEISGTDINDNLLPLTKRKVTSTGVVGTTSKIVQVILRKAPTSGEVNNALTIGGGMNIQGSAEISGLTEQNVNFSDKFEEIFGITKNKMKVIVQNFPNRYYNGAINNDIVENITWVNGILTQSQIQGNWTGNGLLIIDGDLKITGGIIFNGIIWVTGSLEVSAGTPEIYGAIFVESSTTVEITGNLELTYDVDTIDDALGNLGIGTIVEFWQELS